MENFRGLHKRSWRKKICDFKNNNLHVLGYSTNINKVLTSKELKKNIFYLKKT